MLPCSSKPDVLLFCLSVSCSPTCCDYDHNIDATDGTIAVDTDIGARIIDLEAYRARRRATVKSSQPLLAGPDIFLAAFYCFWPAIVWVPVLSGANQDVRDR